MKNEKIKFEDFLRYYNIYFKKNKDLDDVEILRFWSDKISSMNKSRLFAAMEELKEKYLFHKSKGNRPSVPSLGDIEFAYGNKRDVSNDAEYIEIQRRRKSCEDYEIQQALGRWNALTAEKQREIFEFDRVLICSVSNFKNEEFETMSDETKGLITQYYEVKND